MHLNSICSYKVLSQCRIKELASGPHLKIQRDRGLQCYPEFRETEAYSVTLNLER